MTHGIGSLLALFGGGALVSVAARSGDPWKTVGVGLQRDAGADGLSTLYHSVRWRAKAVLQKLSHVSS